MDTFAVNSVDMVKGCTSLDSRTRASNSLRRMGRAPRVAGTGRSGLATQTYAKSEKKKSRKPTVSAKPSQNVGGDGLSTAIGLGALLLAGNGIATAADGSKLNPSQVLEEEYLQIISELEQETLDPVAVTAPEEPVVAQVAVDTFTAPREAVQKPVVSQLAVDAVEEVVAPTIEEDWKQQIATFKSKMTQLEASNPSPEEIVALREELEGLTSELKAVLDLGKPKPAPKPVLNPQVVSSTPMVFSTRSARTQASASLRPACGRVDT
ncbi:hypothetical protein CYMTET_6928 [Cymbomonas tetramitiformis]|uniref:Uncharacterized protein n=1 Tax=Cymbomonas tetramitiformis TaxID=36881 RepID=A0AAE0LI00_9CHLO|nr:hypothetical protein CYMTET_6928 [Cymbomonas tetramitiformis]